MEVFCLIPFRFFFVFTDLNELMSLIDINLQCQRVRVCRADPGDVLAAFNVVNRSFARLLLSFQVVAVSRTPFKESNPELL